jgi:hypothetical protein
VAPFRVELIADLKEKLFEIRDHTRDIQMDDRDRMRFSGLVYELVGILDFYQRKN